MKSPLPQTVFLLVLLFFSPLIREANAQTSSVNVNFNNLPPGVVVTEQYRPYVTFSANGFSAGGGYQTNVFTNSDGTYPGSILSRYQVNPGTTSTDVFMHFLTPVNNLSFKILGVIHPYRVCYIDVFRGGTYYNTYAVYGNSTPYSGSNPLTFNLGSLSNITHVHIYYVANVYCDNARCYSGFVYYDDITFTPDININITNPPGRVSGNLQGTTQNALIGADVSLKASPDRTGGSYSWTFSGTAAEQPTVISGGTNQDSIGLRWMKPGTFKARVTYTLNGISVSSFVDVNVLVPKIVSFNANQSDDALNRDQNCGSLASGATYSLGCDQGGTDGIFWAARVDIPPVNYLTDLNQSGIKFVQAVSALRKYMLNGLTHCHTARSSQGDVESGWQLDTSDPYSVLLPPLRFDANKTLTMIDFDSPGEVLDLTSNPLLYTKDILTVDDRFETYVFYFTGPDPGNPIFQMPVELQNPPTQLTASGGWHGVGAVR